MIIKQLGRTAPGTRLFLAEGQAELGFIETVLQGLKKSQVCTVYCFGGIDNFGTVLKSISDVPGIEKLACLGLMLDAEKDFEARVRSIITHFSNNGAVLSEEEVRTCQISFLGECRLGIFVSPGTGEAGRIEDTIMAEIRAAELWNCVRSFSECVQSTTKSELDTKALVQVYISARKGDLCGVGRAFLAGVLRVEHSAYDSPRAMIQELLEEPVE